MNGIMRKTLASLLAGAGLIPVVGCFHYRQLVDPCWPERYAAEARHNVRDAFNAQAFNGHVLDQTLWAYHFETELDPKTKEERPTDKLHAWGMQHLDYLSRRLPAPDPRIYLQTSRDPKLDEKRTQAIQAYLAGGNQALRYDVVLLDTAQPGLPNEPFNPERPWPQKGLYGDFKLVLPPNQGMKLP